MQFSDCNRMWEQIYVNFTCLSISNLPHRHPISQNPSWEHAWKKHHFLQLCVFCPALYPAGHAQDMRMNFHAQNMRMNFTFNIMNGSSCAGHARESSYAYHMRRTIHTLQSLCGRALNAAQFGIYEKRKWDLFTVGCMVVYFVVAGGCHRSINGSRRVFQDIQITLLHGKFGHIFNLG